MTDGERKAGARLNIKQSGAVNHSASLVVENGLSHGIVVELILSVNDGIAVLTDKMPRPGVHERGSRRVFSNLAASAEGMMRAPLVKRAPSRKAHGWP
jgi:hypothetical protein